jgi:hypothetical protein
MTVTPGTRFRCERCGTETILISGDEADLSCCEHPLTLIFKPGDDSTDETKSS